MAARSGRARIASVLTCIYPSYEPCLTHICALKISIGQVVTMSQIMERWPWPKTNFNKNIDLVKEQCQCASLRSHTSAGSQPQPQTAVKLILWPSNEASEQKKPRKMWSKLPLRQIPSSLSAKMGWLAGASHETAASSSAVKQPNAVFRSNSFRFERPPPEDDARMYSAATGKGPVKSYSITAQDVS